MPATLTAGLAGCLGLFGEADSDPTETSSPTPTPAPTPSETETVTETATRTETIDKPAIERQVTLRDRAAITHVQRTVTGTVEWPSYRSDNLIDPTLLGDWRFEGEDTQGTITFADTREFAIEYADGTVVAGTYYTYDEALVLTWEDGSEDQYGYAVRTDETPTVLALYEEGQLDSRFELSDRSEDTRDAVQVIEDVVILPEEDPSVESRDLRTGSTGSGFVVSPDGYVVTNAHVVGADQAPEEALYQRLAIRQRSSLRSMIEEEFDVGESERRQIEDVMLGKLLEYYEENGQFADVAADVGVVHGRVPPDEDVPSQSWSATVETAGSVRERVQGEPSWGRDVAVLSVDAPPLQTVPLGSATDLGTGDAVFVLGYPDIGVEALFEERSTTLEPTLTSGVVSARRTLNSGVTAIQTDAGINNGNSGGPMYNDDGEVVGIATFTPTDLDLQEIQFGLPIEIATGFMGELGVENEPGALDEAFRAGLEAYWRGDCPAVEEHMSTVLDLAPNHPYAEGFIEDC